MSGTHSLLDTVIIVHLPRPWETFHRRHMILALAKALPPGVMMLCVDRPITLDVTPWRHPARFAKNIWRSSSRIESEKLCIATIRTLLHDDVLRHVPWMSRLNARLMSAQLRKIIRTISPNAARIIQWVYRPEQSWIRWAFPDASLVYECYDEYSCAADGEPLPCIWKLETLVLREAALTFVTANSLLERRRGLAQAIRLIPNGIPEFFLKCPDAIADCIDDIPYPRIGYVGVIRKPMHMLLLHAVFEQNPDWQLVLVGPVESDAGIDRVRELSNVHVVGPRPFESLPAVMKKLDVGLIPHQVNQFSTGLRPLKLVEYLATGIPVVATQLPELSGLERMISFGEDNAASFASAIERALSRRGHEFSREATEWARDLTWDRISERDIIPALIESRIL